MPLMRFEVRNVFGLGDPELLRAASSRVDEPKALLDAVAVAGLVGVLRQLGDLAEFAADVFHDLHEQIIMTAARGRKITTRVQNIEVALPSLEKAVKGQTSHIHFAYVAGSDWHSKLQNEQSHLLSTDLPRFMMDSYEECRDPPKLYLLDKFDNAGAGACLKRYSDPSYFKKAWDSLKVESNGNLQREKKDKEIKGKVSPMRNGSYRYELGLSTLQDGEFQRAHGDNRRRLASLSSDGQSFSDNGSAVDAQSNSEVASSSSDGPKSRANIVEQDWHNSPSQSVNVHEKFPVDTQDNPLHEQNNCRSSSVITWDEKEEIVIAPSEISYEDKIVDKVQDTKSVQNDSIEDHIKQAENYTMKQHKILDEKVKLLKRTAASINSEEFTSETDNYTDARNSLESETESDSRTKTTAKPEADAQETQSSDLPQSDSSNVITADTYPSSRYSFSHYIDARESIGSKEELAAKVDCILQDGGNMVLNETVSSADFVASQQADDGHEPCVTKNNCNFSENNNTSDEIAATMKTNIEAFHSNRCLETSEDHTSSFPVAQTVMAQMPEGSYSKYESEGASYDVHTQSCGPDSGTDKMSNNEALSKTVVNQDSLTEISSDGVTATKLWTNAGLFGLMPSKPPDFGSQNGLEKDLASASAETISHLGDGVIGSSCHSEVPETLNAAVKGMVQRTDFSDNYDQHGCMIIKPGVLNLINSQAQPGVFSNTDFARICLNPASNSIFDSTRSISDSFSSIAQRFLTNTLKRKACLTYPDQASTSETGDSYVKAKDDQSNVGKCNTSSFENSMARPVRMSVPASHRYLEQSSPPLEFMKIPFHPMNVPEINNLKRELSNGDHQMGADSSLLPKFHLPPESSSPLAESGAESDDDDTFGRSYNYSSYDDLSPRFYSNSETWDEQDIAGVKDHEFYSDLDQFRTSLATIAHTGLEKINIPSSVNSYHGMDSRDGAATVESHLLEELPNVDLCFPTNSQQDTSVQSSVCNPSIQSEEHSDIPPLPPLPPVQWRMAKKSAVQDSLTSVTVKDKTTGRATNENEKSRMINFDSKDSDERGELFYQIRSKTFNLRQTGLRRAELGRSASKSTQASSQTATDTNVSAILEKANAIRQAFAGSDDGGDEDSWSDT